MKAEEEVWRLYTEKYRGQVHPRVLAQEAYELGLRHEEMGKHLIDWYEAWVIRILHARREPETGLAVTRSVGGEGIWKQRELWSKEEHYEVILRMKGGIMADTASVVAECDDCRRRHGTAPSLREIRDAWDRIISEEDDDDAPEPRTLLDELADLEEAEEMADAERGE